MAYPIEKKLVIGVASSALFDLEESDKVFRERGEDIYRKYQRDNENIALKTGVAYPFIKRLLDINKTGISGPAENLIEVILLSKNDPDTGLRIRNSIEEYGLNITRSAFLNGGSPYKYIPAFNISLFLSANSEDVSEAIANGCPAGTVLHSKSTDDEKDSELRVAFDFDSVLVNDSAEAINSTHGLETFQKIESENCLKPHDFGPLAELFLKLSVIQKFEKALEKIYGKEYKRKLRISIITARNAPADKRVVTTLRTWGISADEVFFLGGIDKSRILKQLKPHIFFDDQIDNLASSDTIPCVHIPFGIKNKQ